MQIRGDARLYLEEFDIAVEDFTTAAEIARVVGLKGRETYCLRDLAIALIRSGEILRALPLIGQQLEAARLSGEWLGTKYTIEHLVVAFRTLGRPKVAAQLSGVVGDRKMFPFDRKYYSPALHEVRAALGDVEFGRLAAQGEGMPFVDLVRFAEATVRQVIESLEQAAE